MFQKWLAAFVQKFILDLLTLIWARLLAYLKLRKERREIKKRNAEALKKYNDELAKEKPHEERVKDAQDFLNTISKP